MNILLVEDDDNKAARLEECLRELPNVGTIIRHRSYQSGLKALVQSPPPIAVLDMTMPTYDVSPEEKGWRIRPYAGRDILDEVLRRQIRTRVIIVTQFESFGEGAEALTLEQLKSQLAADYPDHYVATVFYQASESGWRFALRKAVERASKGGRGNSR